VKIPGVGYLPPLQRKGQVMGILRVAKNMSNNMKMLNLRCMHVLSNNVDDILKVRLTFGQIMKFTYHPSIKE
jgi:hypothetical protein